MNKLQNMKVKKRLIISFVSTVITASIAGVLGIILLLLVDSRYNTALHLNGFIQGDIGEYNSYLHKSGAFVRDIILLTDEEDIANAQAVLAECDAKVSYYLVEFESKLETAEERALTKLIDEKYPQYIALRDQALELGAQNKTEEAMAIFYDQAQPLLNEITTASEALLTMNMEMGDEIADSLFIFSIIMALVILAVIIVAVTVSIIFATHTARDFSRPIEEVRQATIKLANGELDVHVQINSENEFGEMADYFNKAVENLRSYVATLNYGLSEVAKGNFTVRPNIEFHGDFVSLKEDIENIIISLSSTLGQINDGSDQVALGAEQLADGAQGLAEGATNQAAAIQELTATIENVATAAEDSALKADEANKTAVSYATIARNSSREMQSLTEAMDRISETSKEIESIISEIEDIASQTNLLSLNASIEAARAGEAGRGFAVVADQIGKLAADSAQSAVNTRELIVKALAEITQGNEITLRTADALAQVVEGINLLAAASKESSELSAEQAETMQQVLQGIEQIAEVVQNNSAAAEETSATSEELSAQSQSLKALIENFQLVEL